MPSEAPSVSAVPSSSLLPAKRGTKRCVCHSGKRCQPRGHVATSCQTTAHFNIISAKKPPRMVIRVGCPMASPPPTDLFSDLPEGLAAGILANAKSVKLAAGEIQFLRVYPGDGLQ